MKTLYSLLSLNSNHLNIIEGLIQSERSLYLKKFFEILQSEGSMDDYTTMYKIYGSKRLADFSRLKAKLKGILIRTTLLHMESLEAPGTRTSEGHNQFRNA